MNLILLKAIIKLNSVLIINYNSNELKMYLPKYMLNQIIKYNKFIKYNFNYEYYIKIICYP